MPPAANWEKKGIASSFVVDCFPWPILLFLVALFSTNGGISSTCMMLASSSLNYFKDTTGSRNFIHIKVGTCHRQTRKTDVRIGADSRAYLEGWQTLSGTQR